MPSSRHPTTTRPTRPTPTAPDDRAAADLIPRLREAVADGTPPGPRLRTALLECDEPARLQRAGRVLEKFTPAPDRTSAHEIHVLLLATCTPGSYPDLLRAALFGAGAVARVESGPYGSFEMTLGSGEYAVEGGPDLVSCLLDDAYFLPDDWSAQDVHGVGEYIHARLDELRDLVLGATRRGGADVVLHTVPLPAQLRDSVLGWRERAALAEAWHRLNAGLLHLAEESPRVAVADLAGALADSAVRVRDDRLHRFGDLPYTDAALALLADEVRRYAQATLGLSRKVLALDLDNTLWGGVLGEVGPHGIELGGLYPGNCYQELQRTALRLREQGVVLVAVSKNDAEPVDEVLAEHPEMLLRRDAFSAAAVNWSSKAANLREIAETLALSTDSFVFVDDSPFECGLVADELPGTTVVPAAGDPAHLVRSLLSRGLFDVAELTGTDRARPDLYRTRAERHAFSGGFGSPEEYLRALDVALTPAPANPYSAARMAQLSQRTNQFNLTGERYDEAGTRDAAEADDRFAASFAVRDRFGDEGIVGAAWVRRTEEDAGTGPVWSVENFVLSCRVLGRDVELAAVAWLAERAREAGAVALEGRHRDTGRNGVAADLWERAGFARTSTPGVHRLDLTGELPAPPAWIGLTAADGPDAGTR
ncbi:HAD-IIIC family phosphatase [Streptomyces sp. NPDC088921]|uniref:HAD-IIIC family phosphatase n=1 Tax=unclassified Streptomyces TaxID=2593676 RepID=UPI003426F757